MSRREAREQQFRATPFGFQSIAGQLVTSAQDLLALSLSDRHKKVAKTKHNHYSPNALGALVLVGTAFDVTLNEAIVMSHVFGSRKRGKDVALKSTLAKYRALAGASGLLGDVRMLIDLRDEIVHHLPRHVNEPGSMPKWFKPLTKRHVFLTAAYAHGASGTGPSADFPYTVKLCSYALAYWGWEIAYQALVEVFKRFGEADLEACGWLLSNFEHFNKVCAPSALPAYDKEHGITLTKFQEPA